MKPSTRFASILLFVALTSPLLVLKGCGHDDTLSAAYGGSITISPAGAPWSVGAGACDGTNMQDTDFTITVFGSDNEPAANVTINVSLDLSPSTYPSFPVMHLFDPDVSTTVEVNSPYKTKTGDFGAKTMRVQYDLGGCEYSGLLRIHSGALYQSAAISATVE